jgi:hypothetical protein
MNRHVTLLGTLHIAYGILGVCIGLFLFWFFVTPGLISGEPKAIGVLLLFGTALGGVIALLSVPHVICGYALLKRYPWGRMFAMIIGALSLIDIPFGMVLGIYTLWVMMQDEAAALFRPAVQ